jgi:hypothetical protein
MRHLEVRGRWSCSDPMNRDFTLQPLKVVWRFRPAPVQSYATWDVGMHIYLSIIGHGLKVRDCISFLLFAQISTSLLYPSSMFIFPLSP